MSIDRKIFCGLLLWSVAVLMLMSPDSPIHGDWNHWDSAWFFMGGKAMMNGMRPYVDFTDSKGPLLWLIYGIGYLLSPRSYTGVYVLTCFVYAGIFYYNFKTARIFLKDNLRSLMVTVLMSIPYFLYWFHYLVRAEDFATLFVAASMYYLFHLLYNFEEKTYGIRSTGLVLGGSFMALLLIKYNIAAMQASMILAALWYYFREQRQFWEPVKWLSAGTIIVALPFVVYLLTMGSLVAFFDEYFLNTFRTLDYSGGHTDSYVVEFMKSLENPARLTLLGVIIFGWWLLSKQLKHYAYVPLLTGVFFYCVATKHNIDYYDGACTIFAIYFLIGTLGGKEKPLRVVHLALAMTAILSWGVFENIRDHSDLRKVVIWNDEDEKTAYNDVYDILAIVPQPKMMNLYSGELGFGLKADALPAGKYWSYQYGSTPEMEKEHIALLKSGKADFIIVSPEEQCNAKGFTSDVIESLGYVLCYQDSHDSGHYGEQRVAVYKKKGL